MPGKQPRQAAGLASGEGGPGEGGPGEGRTGADLLAGRLHDQRGCQHCACEGLGGRCEVHTLIVVDCELQTLCSLPPSLPCRAVGDVQTERFFGGLAIDTRSRFAYPRWGVPTASVAGAGAAPQVDCID